MHGNSYSALQKINLVNNKESINVPVISASLFSGGKRALGISHCDSGLPLDLTRGLEIWTFLEYVELDLEISSEFISNEWLLIIGGFGVGKDDEQGQICISEFARELLYSNLLPFKKQNKVLQLEITFPKGQELAERTSNSSFGIVEGLSVIGTQAESQDSASPNQVSAAINQIRYKCSRSTFSGHLTFVIGENGFDLALNLGLDSESIIKTGNWLGPLIVAAAEERVNTLLLFGYHGKLIKLAGGIFHTHHHLADSRLEVLISLAVKEDIPFRLIKLLETSNSIQSALLTLEGEDLLLAKKLWFRLALEVENRSKVYVKRYVSSSIEIGSALFDRQRSLRWAGPSGLTQIKSLGLHLEA